MSTRDPYDPHLDPAPTANPLPATISLTVSSKQFALITTMAAELLASTVEVAPSATMPPWALLSATSVLSEVEDALVLALYRALTPDTPYRDVVATGSNYLRRVPPLPGIPEGDWVGNWWDEIDVDQLTFADDTTSVLGLLWKTQAAGETHCFPGASDAECHALSKGHGFRLSVATPGDASYGLLARTWRGFIRNVRALTETTPAGDPPPFFRSAGH